MFCLGLYVFYEWDFYTILKDSPQIWEFKKELLFFYIGLTFGMLTWNLCLGLFFQVTTRWGHAPQVAYQSWFKKALQKFDLQLYILYRVNHKTKQFGVFTLEKQIAQIYRNSDLFYSMYLVKLVWN